MLLRRIDPVFPLVRLRGEMGQLFDGIFGEGAVDPFGWFGSRAFPTMNFWEDDHGFYAEAEVPGLKMENLEVTVVGNELTLKGERKPLEQAGMVYHRRERSLGTFTRTLRLPAEIDASKVEAKLEHGVLTVTLPKAEQAKPRKVTVRCLGK